MLTVPKYHEVPEPKDPWWANLFLYVLAMTGCLIGAIFSFESKNYWLAGGWALAFFALFVWTTLLGVVSNMGSGSHYYQALKECSLTDLIAASASPEYDDTSKKVIVEFLNHNHPGWSMSPGAAAS